MTGRAGVRVADPATGGLPIGMGLLLIVGSVVPWEHVPGFNGGDEISGVQTDGSTTIVIGFLVAVLGAFVRANRGRLWLVIVGVVISALALGITISKVVDLEGVADRTDITIGFGMWFALAASLLCVLATVRCLLRMTERSVL